MATADILRQLSETLGGTASVKSVYGEPIQVEGRTVVPIARVAYGFGGGFGSGTHLPKKGSEATHAGASSLEAGEGGGGGGGVRAYPAGALEITSDGTRFVPFQDLRWIATAFGFGVAAAILLCRKRDSK